MRLLLALILLAPVAGHAGCGGGEAFVSCPVKGGKTLEVCIAPGTLTYSYGKPGKPDLALSQPMASANVTPWSGVGRAIWSAVIFTNGDFAYEVWSSFDRMDQTVSAGVNVLNGEQIVAEIPCLPGGEIAPAFTLEDAMAANGLCWDRDSAAWRSGACP